MLKSESTLERWLPRLGRDKVLLQSPRRKPRTDLLKPTRLNKTRIAMDDIVHSPHTSTHYPADGIDWISTFGPSTNLNRFSFSRLPLFFDSIWTTTGSWFKFTL